MNRQKKAWKTRRKNNNPQNCIVCKKNEVSSKKSKTCSRKCASKLAWITGKKDKENEKK